MLGLAAARADAILTAYVANGSGTVSQFAISRQDLLAPLTPATVPAGTNPFGVVVSPDGRNVYVTDAGVGNLGGGVSQFSVDRGTGQLTAMTPATVAAGLSPQGIAVTPNGRFVYVPDLDGNVVQGYRVDRRTGSLSRLASVTVATGTAPEGIVVTPDGRSVFVVNSDDATVSQYTADPSTGMLVAKSPAEVALPGVPLAGALALGSHGRRAYALGSNGIGNGDVFQFRVGRVRSGLKPLTPPSVEAGADPVSVAMTPDGRSAYVTNQFGGISQYSVDPRTGALSAKVPATVATAPFPFGVVVTPDSRAAYVTNGLEATVSQYSINRTTGRLTPAAPATVATAVGPNEIAIDANSRAH